MVHNTVASLQSHTITSEMPPDIPWHVIRDITNDFSEERQIGRGGYGVVYKGVHEKGREVAVKKLYHMPGLDEMQYQSEIQNLEGLYHPNIVRLVGKSYIEQDRCVEYKGKLVFATMIDRAICLEYVPNGSLEKHLYDEFSGFSWTARYKIIKGICLGLEYLHQRRIFHLDLKPANILLDQDMLPKIADFGLSRIFSGTRQSHTTNKFIGTIGYLPPEYIEKGKISEKFDVFSLGVIIIKLLTGPDVYGLHSDLSSEEFIEQVHGNWKKRLEKNGLKDASYLDALCQQVKTCIEMAINCVQTDRHKRPRIRDIIHILNGTETTFDETYKQLFVIQPQSLCFPFRPDMLIPCPLQITNNMDQGIAFRIRPKIPNLFVRSSLHGYVTARSTHTHILVIEKQQKPMLLNPDSIVIQSSVEGLDPSDWRDDTKVIHHDEIKEVRQTSLQDINPDSIVSQSSVEGLDPSDWRDDLKVIHHDEIKEVRQLTSEVQRPLQLSAALQLQLEVQARLHEQLEVQRQLQLRIDRQGKYLQRIIEEQQRLSAAGASRIIPSEQLPDSVRTNPSTLEPESESPLQCVPFNKGNRIEPATSHSHDDPLPHGEPLNPDSIHRSGSPTLSPRHERPVKKQRGNDIGDGTAVADGDFTLQHSIF